MAVQAAPHRLGDDFDQPVPGLGGGLRWPLLLLLAAALLLVMTLAIAVGAVSIPPDQVLAVLLSRLPGMPAAEVAPVTQTIVWELRVPRVLLAGLVGAVLGVAGATYQGVFRNPLADPYLIGVAGGAGLGATLALLLPTQPSFYGFSSLPLFAFVGALAAVSVAYLVARTGPAVPSGALVLAGVAVASLTGAVTSFLLVTSGERIQVIFTWLLGGFGTASWNQVGLVAPYALGMLLLLVLLAHLLDVLQLGDDQARQLGVPVERVRLLLLAAASLATAAAVAVSGLIGFVGLIVPHLVRLVAGPGHRALVPLSALAGAVFMILCDLLARSVLGSVELPVGVITALCGAPFFLWLLHRRRAVFL